MNTIKWDKRFLGLAKVVGSWSKDPSTQVGAVIVDQKKRIISIGFNGFPTGVEDSDELLLNREEKYEIIVHAEANALMFANRSVEGCTIYTHPFQPCSKCAGLIIQAGLTRVVSIGQNTTRWKKNFSTAAKLFGEAGVSLTLYEGME